MLLLACGDDSSGDGSGRDGGAEDGGGRKDGGGGSGRGGTGGGGTGGTSGRDGGGVAVNECRNASMNDCDEHATCTDTPTSYRCECQRPAWEGDGKTCECADGYTEVDGECVAENGAECDDDDACESGHCVSGVCCASACDSPDACQVEEGATCEDGETCEYAQADDGEACEDGDACTVEDTCEDGECTAGAARDCDDDNVCTVDSCNSEAEDPRDACVNDGTDITTAGCRDDDMCGSDYECDGTAKGECVATVPAEPCPESTDPCQKAVCNGATGCGFVAKGEGDACEDGDQCTVGEACEEGVCGGGSARDCNDGNDCTTDSCNPDTGCAPEFNTESCNDSNLCTSGDVCHNGECAGVNSVTCTASDQCHMVGTCSPATGQCSNPAKPDETVCEDNNNCTQASECSGGVCTGIGNSCVGECAALPYPCDPNATCTDPSTTTTGDYDCECKTGFTGNGQTCTDIDECMNNPCGDGRGTCTQGAPGTYSCTCGAGFKEVTTAEGKTCVCDMTGTFAFRTVSVVKWDPVMLTSTIELLEGGMGETVSWGIRKQTYSADGKLNTRVRACSGTAPDICDSADFAIPMSEAYQQFEPNSFYDNNVIDGAEPQFNLPRPLGGSAFITPNTAILLGIDLTNDYGTWPANRGQVGGTNPTNGAAWITYTAGIRGVVTMVVPPGGVDNGPNGAPKVFGATSADCPRNDPQAARYPYAYLPNPSFGQPPIVSVRSGSRLQSSLDGHFDTNSCDRITGEVKGPDNGFPLFEGRFDGCTTTSGACSDATVNSLDAEPQTQQIISTSFVIERVADDFDCQDARTHNYNP